MMLLLLPMMMLMPWSLLLLLPCVLKTEASYGNRLNRFIRHYEGLSYSTEELHAKHTRARRAISPLQQELALTFQAHGRHFDLRMRRDTRVFSDDFKVQTSQGLEEADTSHIYTGSLHGEKGSLCHGAVMDGRFEGFIGTSRGTFYVERVEHYLLDMGTTSSPPTPTGPSPFPATSSSSKSPLSPPPLPAFHSVIYHEDDVEFPHKYGPRAGCAHDDVLERMRRFQESAVESDSADSAPGDGAGDGPAAERGKRAATSSAPRNTCPLYIQADHTYYAKYENKEAVLAQISVHVVGMERVYQSTNFNGIKDISFVVKRVRINTTEDALDVSNPFRSSRLGVEKFLDLNSEQNHNDFCLAYVMADRNFGDGVLGLAWVGSPTAASGGICEKNKLFSDRTRKSLNTGIVTVNNYGSHVPLKVSIITITHEVGHNFGSPHDSEARCMPGESQERAQRTAGNYLMYPYAQSGDKPNNMLFSPCSIDSISKVLKAKRNLCFIESDTPVCGNGLVEEDEECDCGFGEDCADSCCFPASAPAGQRCRLRPDVECSPSEGPCCSHECKLHAAGELCRPEAECSKAGVCSGDMVICLASEPKDNHTVCNRGSQICMQGLCSGSICELYGLEECLCPGESPEVQCHICCSNPGESSSCAGTSDERWRRYFNGSRVALQPGSPCDGLRGYCDAMRRCRRVDAEGPLVRLKKAFFEGKIYLNVVQWVQKYWWGAALIGVGVVVAMILFIVVCSAHVPSSNPNFTPPRFFSASRVSRPTRGRDVRARQPRQSIEMQ
ncbi:disintegrin and metalloproteinase domain-containing protein 10-like isoform X1 [Lethenteron reissneri]|uniref:disintegrin and metalloproteinase domain-containing protein 10-like isoform X1 n=1 Tax=Lethenteron reissneri TaxID=7753 RepID=UPI002AB759AC|nr:disintegrin and metalloproteinase domain-containing protein 10-like isoform X1 [Lethenteron reissneri]